MARKSEDETKVGGPEEQAANPLATPVLVSGLAVYLVVLGIIMFWALVAFFPAAIANGAEAPKSSNVGFMFWNFNDVSGEVRLIVLVIVTGALGSLVHAFRSLFWYVGNRAFAKSWVLMYLLLPLIGSALSLIFYLVLRGGLFSPNASVEATSPFGFIGVAGLVGMFSNRAALKLQEIAESIFSTKESTKGKDNVDSEQIAEEAEKAKGKANK